MLGGHTSIKVNMLLGKCLHSATSLFDLGFSYKIGTLGSDEVCPFWVHYREASSDCGVQSA